MQAAASSLFAHQFEAFCNITSRFHALSAEQPHARKLISVLTLECADLSDALYVVTVYLRSPAPGEPNAARRHEEFLEQAIEICSQLSAKIDASLPVKAKRSSWLRRRSSSLSLCIINDKEWLGVVPILWSLNTALRTVTQCRGASSRSLVSPLLILDDAILMVEACRRSIPDILTFKGANIPGAAPSIDKGLSINAERLAANLKELNQLRCILAGQPPGSSTSGLDNSTRLSRAAANGEHRLVQLLPRQDAENLGPRRKGFTPLNESIFHNHRGVAEALLARNDSQSNGIANMMIDRPCHRGGTPLYWAASHGDLIIVEELLRLGAEAAQPRVGGKTPLHVAAVAGHFPIVQKLIGLEVPVNSICHAGSTALHAAVGSNHIEIARALLAAGADSSQHNLQGLTPLHVAVSKSEIGMVEMLVQSDPSMVEHKERAFGEMTAVEQAARLGNADIVRILVIHGADLSRRDFKCLSDATSRGHTEVVQYLLTQIPREVITQYRGDTSPLMLAVAQHNVSIVQAMLLHAVDAIIPRPGKGDTILHVAAHHRHEDIVEAILDDAATDIDVVDDQGRTALLYAAINGKKGVVQLLLERGANIPGSSNSYSSDERNLASSLKLISRIAKSLESSGKKINSPAGWDERLDTLAAHKENNWRAQRLINQGSIQHHDLDTLLSVDRDDPGYSVSNVTFVKDRPESSLHRIFRRVGPSHSPADASSMFMPFTDTSSALQFQGLPPASGCWCHSFRNETSQEAQSTTQR